MPEQQSELEKFLGDIGSSEPKLEETPKEELKVEEKDSEEEPKLNRQQRRQIENASIRRQLEEEREARIRAEERAKAIGDLKAAGEGNAELHALLFGSQAETPESKLIAQNLAKVLEDNRQAAVEEAYSRIQSEQAEERAEVERNKGFIDDQLAAVEEAAGIDLTSNSQAARKAREEFLDVVEKLSPKDEDGNITAFADFGAAYEMYAASKRPQTNPRRNEIASRSMAKSSEPNLAEEKQDETRNWLRRMGIKV